VDKSDSRKKFEDTPKGWQERWSAEMETSCKFLEKFWEQGDKVVDRYLDKRDDAFDDTSRLNLFHSGINTIRSMLYGQVPRVDFSRRFDDQNDDVARVASNIYDRILNADIERPDDDYAMVLRTALDDKLLTGLGVARVRYEAEFEDVTVPAVYSEDGVELAPEFLEPRITRERAAVDYTHWKDFRWSYARTWHEVRWIAFRSYLTYDELVARFGEEKAKAVPLATEKGGDGEKDTFQKGEIWEIWNKENKKVYWWAQGMINILDSKDDTLGLRNFFPAPRPMMSNVTTKLLVPKADFLLAQDLYNEIDILHTRISKLTIACRVVGAYDQSIPELKRMLEETAENRMIPVENWAMFGEKSGLKGVVDWFPLEQVVNTLDKLRELRSEQIALLYQVTGLSDILRGQAEGSDRVSATEQSIKAKFASVRLQALQDEFARFGTDLIRLKAELVSKHCSDEMILKSSNIMNTPDAELAGPALQLLRSDEDMIWRLSVRPESMAMVDYQALQQERTGYITALATFMQSAAPMLERLPNSLPTLLELLKWGLAGFKGSDNIEAVLDQAAKQVLEAAQNPPPQPPDPAMVKAQAEMQKMQAELQADGQRMQQEMQLEREKMQLDVMKAQMELQQDREKFIQEMMQDREKHMMEMQQMREKLSMDAIAGEQKLEQQEEAAEIKNEAVQSKSQSTT
jgi:hypothetical protein